MFESVCLIKFSPKQAHIFSSLQKEQSPNSPNLKPLCPTKWTCRTPSIHAVLENYTTLLVTLEEINASCKDEYGRKAGGFLPLMEKFSTFFWFKDGTPCLQCFRLSSTLQRKKTTVQEAFIAANFAKPLYYRQRDPSAFQAFYKQVVSDTEGKTDPPTLPRYHKAPRHTDDLSSGQTHMYDSPCDFYRQQYFQIMESLSGELTGRFEQKRFRLVSQLESLLLDSSNGNFQEIPAEVVDMYARDVDMDCF